MNRFLQRRGDDERSSSTSSISLSAPASLATKVEVDTKCLRTPEAHWECEFADAHPCRKRLERLVDSVALEVVVTVAVLMDLIITVSSMIIGDEGEEPRGIFYLTAVLLIVLLIDVLLRMIKEGCLFFYKWLNWIEFLVAISGPLFMIIELFDKSASMGSKATFGRTIRPVLKVMRILRSCWNATMARGGVHGRIDRATDKLMDRLVQQYLGDILRIPPENCKVKISDGSFHLEKAQFRSNAFQGLHLPFTVLGGLIELVHVDFDLHEKRGDKKSGSSGADWSRARGLLIVIENLLLVVGPGHHQEYPEPPWTIDSVMECKKKLVEMVAKRIEALAKPKKSDGTEVKKVDGGKVSMKNVVERAKKRSKQVVENALSRGIHLAVRHIEIRYEDSTGALMDGQAILGGFQIGSLQLRAEAGGGDHGEADFRVDSRWRPGISEDVPEVGVPSSTCGGAASMATASTSAGGKGTGSRTTAPDSPSSKLGRGLSNTSQLYKSVYSSSGAAKPSLMQGVRVACDIEHISVYWDAELNGWEGVREGRLAHMLGEGIGTDYTKFLTMMRCRRLWERVRLSVCRDAGRHLVQKAGGNTTDRLLSQMRERCRRLRDRLCVHHYLLPPFAANFHMIVKRMQKEVTFSEFWMPVTDLDLRVPIIEMCMDLSQAKTLHRLLAFFKKWQRDDDRFQWRPPPHHTDFSRAFARWAYAVRWIQHSINPKYNWHSRAWLEMRRKAAIRSEYTLALCAVPQDQCLIDMLQVCIPLKEVLLTRQATASIIKAERQARAKLKRQRCCAKATSSFPTSSKSKSLDLDDLEEAQGNEESDLFREDSEGKADDKKPKAAKIPAEKAIQLRVHVDAIHILSCKSSTQVRQPLVKMEVTGLIVSAAKAAPLDVWLRLAPHNATAAAADREPFSFAVQGSVSDILGLCFAAPKEAPKLRRMVSRGVPSQKGSMRPCVPLRGAGKEVVALQFSAAQLNSFTPIESDCGESPSVNRGGKEDRSKVVKAQYWQLAAVVSPMEVRMCRPLLQELLLNYHPKQQELYRQQWSAHHRMTQDEQLEAESQDFKERLAEVRLRWYREKGKRWKNEKQYEKFSGKSTSASGNRIAAKILLAGGCQAQIYRPWSSQRWLSQTVRAPLGVIEVIRGGRPPTLRVHFHPVENTEGSGENKADVEEEGKWGYQQPSSEAKEPKRGGQQSPPRKGNGDESCVGQDAAITSSLRPAGSPLGLPVMPKQAPDGSGSHRESAVMLRPCVDKAVEGMTIFGCSDMAIASCESAMSRRPLVAGQPMRPGDPRKQYRDDLYQPMQPRKPEYDPMEWLGPLFDVSFEVVHGESIGLPKPEDASAYWKEKVFGDPYKPVDRQSYMVQGLTPRRFMNK